MPFNFKLFYSVSTWYPKLVILSWSNIRIRFLYARVRLGCLQCLIAYVISAGEFSLTK